jgi:Ser/Thr protein kinase RdoA (MazF antagonist)
MDWLELPTDPELPALPRLQASAGEWRVLRFVPLRRMTLWHQPPSGPARIVKLKRPDRAADAAHRLALAFAATNRRPGIAMPRLLKTSPDGAFALPLCPGTPLGAGLPCDAATTLRAIGRMQATLHRCSPTGLPPDDPPLHPLPLIAALCPGLPLSDLADQLRHRPAPSALVLCHGDFALDQILLGPDGLSLVDFDHCHRGEAAADIARFLVTLAEAPPPGLTAAQAGPAYLAGYAEIREPPNPALLDWHFAEAVANRILVCLRKDQPHLIPRLLEQVQGQVPA